MKRALTILIIIAVIAVAAFFGYRRIQQTRSSALANLQTVTIGRGDLTASVGATGTVRSNQTAILSWGLNGRIAKINVAIGDQVKSGQVLAQLDETTLPQAVILARSDLVTAQRNLDQLLQSNVAQAKAQQTLVAAQKELDDAKKNRDSKNYSRALPATVDEARANLVIAENAVKEATKQYDRVDGLPQDNPIRAEAFAQLSKANKNYDTQLANLNWLLGRPDTVELGQADARLALAEASLKDAQREWDRLKNGPDPEDVVAAKARIAAIESTLAQVAIATPFGGTVTDVSGLVGDQVNPGTAAFRIDDLSRLLVDVQITEVDINSIRVGQPVMMTFDAISNKDYSGKVVEVARVGIASQGVVNFTVTVEINNPDNAVRPGMTAAVNIITNLVENVLVVPNRAVRLRDNNHVVYVERNGAMTMVQIDLGLTSDTMSEITGGDVKEGDVLVLNPPTQFQPPAGGGASFRGPGGGQGQ